MIIINGFLNEVEYGEKTLQAAKDITDADMLVDRNTNLQIPVQCSFENLFEFINYKQLLEKLLVYQF